MTRIDFGGNSEIDQFIDFRSQTRTSNITINISSTTANIPESQSFPEATPIAKMAFTKTSHTTEITSNFVLSAYCRPLRPRTKYYYSSLNLDLYLGNNDGHFVWGSGGITRSAKNAAIRGALLSADLRTRNGEWRRDSINLDAWVRNDDGRLRALVVAPVEEERKIDTVIEEIEVDPEVEVVKVPERSPRRVLGSPSKQSRPASVATLVEEVTSPSEVDRSAVQSPPPAGLETRPSLEDILRNKVAALTTVESVPSEIQAPVPVAPAILETAETIKTITPDEPVQQIEAVELPLTEPAAPKAPSFQEPSPLRVLSPSPEPDFHSIHTTHEQEQEQDSAEIAPPLPPRPSRTPSLAPQPPTRTSTPLPSDTVLVPPASQIPSDPAANPITTRNPVLNFQFLFTGASIKTAVQAGPLKTEFYAGVLPPKFGVEVLGKRIGWEYGAKRRRMAMAQAA